MASPTTRDYAHKTKAYAEQRNAEEIERAAAWARTLRERFEAARDAPGGYIREHADDFCPTAMPTSKVENATSKVENASIFRLKNALGAMALAPVFATSNRQAHPARMSPAPTAPGRAL